EPLFVHSGAQVWPQQDVTQTPPPHSALLEQVGPPQKKSSQQTFLPEVSTSQMHIWSGPLLPHWTIVSPQFQSLPLQMSLAPANPFAPMLVTTGAVQPPAEATPMFCSIFRREMLRPVPSTSSNDSSDTLLLLSTDSAGAVGDYPLQGVRPHGPVSGTSFT